MNNKADRLKSALRENLKRRKAHMRERNVGKDAAQEKATAEVVREETKDNQ
ncbi:hypothetical protein WJT86_03775 [Microvirga sp. W0021]|uniref:DUF4169 family protein n=1 Tax=Hohaiivirga grylli TaxID=3133970 RepID=A0ABV0BH15_9HYPH